MASGYPDYQGDKAAVFTPAEWAAFESRDKSLVATAINKTFGQWVLLSYTVPAGKTLYIVQSSIAILASAAADGDNNQFGYLYLYNFTTGLNLAFEGCNGGATILFPKPETLAAGEVLYVYGVTRANHSVDLWVSATGWEE